MRRRQTVFAIVVALTVVVALANAGGASRTPANPPVSGYLAVPRDAPNDGVLNDPYGPYVGGVNGVKAELGKTSNPPAWTGFTNLVINIVTTSGKNHRYFLLSYPSTGDTGCDPGTGPTRTSFQYAGVIAVHSIGAMAFGEVRAVNAYVTSPDGEFGWTGERGVKCSTTVAAYRFPVGNVWTITTDMARLADAGVSCATPGVQCDANNNIQAILNTDGTAYVVASPINQLGFTTGFLGNYSLPFVLHVSSSDARALNTMCASPGCSIPY